MRMSVVATAILLAGLIPASAQSVGERTGVNSAIGVSPSTADFVKEAAIGGMFEVEASKIAAQKAPDQATKQFANMMVQDHTKANGELKSKATAAKINVPAALDKSHQDKLAKMKSQNPADFTKNYHSTMLSDHKDTVSLFERYAKGGDNASIKTWAGQTLPTLQHHLQMAQDLDK